MVARHRRDRTLVCCKTAFASCLTVEALREGSWFVFTQQMSSHLRKPHFFKQCRPASKPSALPHLHHANVYSAQALSSHQDIAFPPAEASPLSYTSVPHAACLTYKGACSSVEACANATNSLKSRDSHCQYTVGKRSLKAILLI